MGNFQESLWADPEFSRAYLTNAGHFIPDRLYFLRLLASFYKFHFGAASESSLRLCDLGAGDGILTATLLDSAPGANFSLVDGSPDMLAAAKKILGEDSRFVYQILSFQDLISGRTPFGPHDFVYSSFAIHHLDGAEKAGLFERVFQGLNPGGAFLNIDTVFPRHAVFINWYYQFWGEWIARNSQETGHGKDFSHIPGSARANPDNKLTSIDDQLDAMRGVGFREVECHYRNGLFCIYSGSK